MLNDALSAEVATRKASDTKFTDDITGLSSAIDNKISVGSYDGTDYSFTQSDLSIVQIDADTYHKMVADGETDDNVVYVVSSDYVNAYDNLVKNVKTPENDTDAANKKYVDDTVKTAAETIKSTSLSGITVNGIAATVADNVATLQIDLINCGDASTTDIDV